MRRFNRQTGRALDFSQLSWHLQNGENNQYFFDKEEMITPGDIAGLIEYILGQPKRILFKNVVFVPMVEQWWSNPLALGRSRELLTRTSVRDSGAYCSD